MKLIFCPSCEDVVRLVSEPRVCMCGVSGGYYLEDGLNAEIWGEAVPLGFANGRFVEALRSRPQSGWGYVFPAFIIPHECGTIRKLEAQ